ncbi:MAG: hypothetical protein V4671_08675 [Armatimonadota bacterium]
MNKSTQTPNFSTCLNAPIARIAAGAPSPSLKRSRRQVPACLFLERFTLEQREVVIGRFYSNPGTIRINGFLDPARPDALVRHVRAGVCDTLSEYECFCGPLRAEQYKNRQTLCNLRDALDSHTDEALAFAHHVLVTCLYRETLQSEGACAI